jgi:hypothetical protein
MNPKPTSQPPLELSFLTRETPPSATDLLDFASQGEARLRESDSPVNDLRAMIEQLDMNLPALRKLVGPPVLDMVEQRLVQQAVSRLEVMGRRTLAAAPARFAEVADQLDAVVRHCGERYAEQVESVKAFLKQLALNPGSKQ